MADDIEMNPFDRIANWIPEDFLDGERYVWVKDKATKTISWKSRNVYQCWKEDETARLQEIFKEMTEQLDPSIQAKDNDQFHLLMTLKERVIKSHEGFLKAHDTIFGLIYQFFFAYFLSDYFQDLSERIDQILVSSLSNLNIVDLSPEEIEMIDHIIKEKSIHPSLDIDWKALSLEQFKVAYLLEPFSQSISLDSLTKEEITFLLDKNTDKIENFKITEIERNLSKIDPRFLSDLTRRQVEALDCSQLTGDEFLALFLNCSSYYYFTSEQIKQLNFSHFNSSHISKMLERDRLLLTKLSPQSIANHLSLFELENLTHFSPSQVAALDISQLTSDQLLHLPYFFITSQQWLQLNLANFTPSTISTLLDRHPLILGNLSPATVAANLDRINVKYYPDFNDNQLKEIDYLFLNDQQKQNFYGYQQRKMKNYPLKNYQQDFFGANFNQNPFGANFNFKGFGKQDFPRNDWWSSFFNDFGGEDFPQDDDNWWKNFTSGSNDTQDNHLREEILRSYHTNIESAHRTITTLNQPHPDSSYEKLRSRMIKNKDNIKNNPKLIFVDDVKNYEEAKLKIYYKKLVMLFHPDKNADRIQEASELFKVVNEAYKVLADPKNKTFFA